MSDISVGFRRELVKIGIVSYREQETLWEIGKRCATTLGLPMAGAGAVALGSVGSVTVPGFGAIPGTVAGFLAGLFAGTLTCTIVNVSYRSELKRLLD